MEQTQRRDPEDARVAGERAEAIGAYLARQRRLRGISLDELAAATRIPIRSLQRLETGAFDHEPDGFARGFVRTVAVALGLPPDETVARMLPEATGDTRRSVFRGEVGWRALGVFTLLLTLGLVVLVWQGSRVLPIGWTRDRDTLLVRRDAVRALAEQYAATHPAPPDAPRLDAPQRVVPQPGAPSEGRAGGSAEAAAAGKAPKASAAHEARPTKRPAR
jgi:transcriptional regulator with XRE-family HTH domain